MVAHQFFFSRPGVGKLIFIFRPLLVCQRLGLGELALVIVTLRVTFFLGQFPKFGQLL
jgi:hypothetical protein